MQEPEDARRIADGPARIQRAPRARARKRGRLRAGEDARRRRRSRARPPSPSGAGRSAAKRGPAPSHDHGGNPARHGRPGQRSRRRRSDAAGAAAVGGVRHDSRRRRSAARSGAGAAQTPRRRASPTTAVDAADARREPITRRPHHERHARRPSIATRTPNAGDAIATSGTRQSPGGRTHRQAQGTAGLTTSSEARGRRSALRPGDQRRRRASRALRRRASRASRRGRGPHDLRHRLRDVAQRAPAWRGARSTASRSGAFRVKHERDPERLRRRSDRVFEEQHSLADELAWLDAEGPDEPGARRLHRRARQAYDYCLFFSYRYYHAYHGVRAAAPRAILVPTAERDAAIGLAIFRPVFRGVRALMYNSPEERAMIQAVAGNQRRAGRRRRHRLGRAGRTRSRTIPAEVRHPRPVRGLRRADRREQGVQGALRVFSGRTCATSRASCRSC